MRWPRRWAAPGLAALLAGCAPEAATPDAEPAPTEHPTLDGVSWTLDWALDGAITTAAGWSVTNDQGVTFDVQGGWLVDYSMTLVPCDHHVATRGWERWLGIGSAQAAHEVFEDPSEWTTATVEALASPSATPVGTRTFPSTRYCSVHWLVARGDEGAVAADGADLQGVALSMHAPWRGGDETGFLSIETGWTQGVLMDLHVPAHPDAGGVAWHADLTIVRSLGHLFDGIDPRSQTELEVAWALLTNLVEGASVRVGPR